MFDLDGPVPAGRARGCVLLQVELGPRPTFVTHVAPFCILENHAAGPHLCEQAQGPLPPSPAPIVLECASVTASASETAVVLGAVCTDVLVHAQHARPLHSTSPGLGVAVLSQMFAAMPPYWHVGIKRP